MDVKFVGSFVKNEQCPKDNKIEFAFIGRSNVGKSSLINMICNQQIAYVSQTPGKTQHLNYYDVDGLWYLVDLPGYGYAQTSKANRKAWGAMIENFLIERTSVECAFLLIDACVPPQKIDLEFVEFLGENEVPFTIIFTKTDRRKKGVSIEENIQAFTEKMSEMFEPLPQFFQTSAETGLGKNEILDYIQQVRTAIS